MIVRLPLTQSFIADVVHDASVESIENRNVLRHYVLVRAFGAFERDISMRHAHNGKMVRFRYPSSHIVVITTTVGMQTEETNDENDKLCTICIMCRKKTFECVIDRRRSFGRLSFVENSEGKERKKSNMLR